LHQWEEWRNIQSDKKNQNGAFGASTGYLIHIELHADQLNGRFLPKPRLLFSVESRSHRSETKNTLRRKFHIELFNTGAVYQHENQN
jgi:hypothetical protein